MNRARWYSSSTVLLNGEIYIQGGSGGTDRPGGPRDRRHLPAADRRGHQRASTSCTRATSSRRTAACSATTASASMYYVNTAGTGAVSSVGQFSRPRPAATPARRCSGPGRILQFGGNSNGAVVIDITQRRAGGDVDRNRCRRSAGWSTRTVLADGKVLATGGSCGLERARSTSTTAPRSGTRRPAPGPSAPAATARACTTRLRCCCPTPACWSAAAARPARRTTPTSRSTIRRTCTTRPAPSRRAPAIAIAPSVLDIGQTFAVDFVSAQTHRPRGAWSRRGSVTHSCNMEQRFVELTFTASGNRLTVQAPTRAADAPPGFYLLFVLDSAGVPSVATHGAGQRRDGAEPGDDADPHRSRQPGSTWSVRPCRCSSRPRDPNGDALGYGASGLPAGLSINGTTGRITGTPTAAGIFNVVVAASDGVNSDVSEFRLDHDPGAAPLTIDPHVAARAAARGRQRRPSPPA